MHSLTPWVIDNVFDCWKYFIHPSFCQVEYQEAWKSIFRDAVSYTKRKNPKLCQNCRACIIVWIMDLEAIDVTETLVLTLSGTPAIESSLCHKDTTPVHYSYANPIQTACKQLSSQVLLTTAKLILERVHLMRSFNHFLKGKRTRKN